MRALTKKLFREVGHLRGQIIAIVLVIACGIANFAAFRSVGASLQLTRSSFYDETRFPDIFITAKRVPETIAQSIAAIQGVALVQTRIVQEALLDLPGLSEPASGTILSIPDHGQPNLSRLFLRSGRWVKEGSDNEVIISSAFADANLYTEGSQFKAVINGHKRQLTVVGICINPEYIIEMPPGTMIIDNKRYGTMYMARSALAAATDMTGAFNSAVVKLEPGASEKSVREHIDELVEQYGAIGSIGRDEQISHRFLNDEIAQVTAQAVIIPSIFLGVAIFLLNVALLRLVSTQRMSVAILKAFGYTSAKIGLHYVGFALIAVAGGTVLGLIGGDALGQGLTKLYAKFYRFPVLQFDMPEGVILGGVLLSVAAAVLGAVGAVRSIVRLPPAEAMRPAAPKSFRPGMLDRLGIMKRLDPVSRMMWRTIVRRPLKTAISTLAIGLAMAILIIGRSMFDMFNLILDYQFNKASRQDANVSFMLPRSETALYSVMNLPGVLRAEPFRMVPVDVSFERHTRRLAITSITNEQELVRVVDENGKVIPVPQEGLVLTGYLADKFGLREGDYLTVQLLEGDRRTINVQYAGRADEVFGVQAYMNRDALSRLLDEQGSVSGVNVLLDPDYEGQFSAGLKNVPAASGVITRRTTIQSFDDNYKENMDISTFYMVGFAVVIAFGVVYNSARIALSERSTELAQLRILGFTLSEISLILVGEQLIITMMAIPVGVMIGWGTVLMLPSALSNDLFRFPGVLTVSNVGIGAATIVIVAMVTGILIWFRLRRLDLIAVLKSRE